ncbi:MAG TPA: hypothetical protein DCO77_12810 [Nitrospiraceae bacterium]|nr:hypothetical protein [Nitrospiraceae bacterium]
MKYLIIIRVFVLIVAAISLLTACEKSPEERMKSDIEIMVKKAPKPFVDNVVDFCGRYGKALAIPFLMGKKQGQTASMNLKKADELDIYKLWVMGEDDEERLLYSNLVIATREAVNEIYNKDIIFPAKANKVISRWCTYKILGVDPSGETALYWGDNFKWK